MGARMPGASPSAIDDAYFDARDEVPPYKEEPWHQSERHAAKLGETMAWVMSGEPVPELDAERDLAAQAPAPSAPTSPRCPTPRCWPGPAASRRTCSRCSSTTCGRRSARRSARGRSAAISGGARRARRRRSRLVAGIGDVDSAAPSWALWDLSRLVGASTELTALFDAGIDGLLERLQGRPAIRRCPAAFLADFDDVRRTRSAHAGRTSGTCGPRRGRPTHSWRWPPSSGCASRPTAHRPASGHAAVVAERERLTAQRDASSWPATRTRWPRSTRR